MKIEDLLQLPQNTCAYERYDPHTLLPLNEETNIRLQELGWASEDFAGKTVLDIGCNSGLLTTYALRLGATKVHACDVQAPLVEFVSRVVASQKLPVTVVKTGFNELQPGKDKADIVLFMEVLHWAVSQGHDLRWVIQHLASLTRQILYIEFPWSIKEPSIQKQTKLTEERYSAEAVFDELTRYFKNVRVVRFMHYFGFGSQSVRVLVEAREKRPEADIFQQLPQLYSLGKALSRGRNETYLQLTARGPKVAKLLAKEFLLGKIPESVVDQLFDELINKNHPRTVVMPEKLDSSYSISLPEGRRWMIFPFIGRLPSAGRIIPPSSDIEQLSDLFVAVRNDLRNVSENLLAALRSLRVFVNVSMVASADAKWTSYAKELAPIQSLLFEAVSCLRKPDLRLLDSVCHGDLQTGNFVLDEQNAVRVIDLDTLGIGPIYSDGLTGLIWRGGSEAIMKAFTDKLGKEEKRPATRFDVAFALGKALVWYVSVKNVDETPEIREQIARLVKGLENAMAFSLSLAPPR